MPIKLMPVYRRGGYNPHYTATPMSGEFPAPIRVGREYSHPARVLKLHDAGAGLVDPCEVHAWDDLILDGEIAVCRCKRDGR